MDKFEAFRLFVQVVDAGSFTKGAQRSELPKSAVTQKIQRLEKELSVKLLHRNTRRLGLTPEGELLYSQVLPILAATEAIEEGFKECRSIPSGVLRLQLRANTAKLIVLPEISDFLDRYPGIHLELFCSDRPIDLVASGIDCALRGGPIKDETVVAIKIGETRPIFCASPTYLARVSEPGSIHDLRRHSVVIYREAGSTRAQAIQDFLCGETVSGGFRRTHLVDDVGVQIAAAKVHAGIIRIVEDLVRDDLASGALVQVLREHEGDAYPMHVIYPANRHLPQRVRVFIDWIRALFARRLSSSWTEG